ncbi:MAG TPA: hypothetical protein VEU96_06315 [Bryobacteraceae bacterium]|nr:hypothetical protein [Bryobacteraceae bacterium]
MPRRLVKNIWLVVALCFASAPAAVGQPTPANSQGADPLRSVMAQMEQLRLALNDMRDQLAESRREGRELRRELQTVQEQLNSIRAISTRPGGESVVDAKAMDRTAALAEEQELLAAKVADQYQTKVESGSKYRVRLSGLALLNVVSTNGSVDNLDLPGIARPKSALDSNGSFGVTLRQSLIRLDVTGPNWGGARTSGDLSFDFFGGFPATSGGITSGLVRLRTAKVLFDWPNTTVAVGQDAPFFSPLSPTSLASTAYPALSSAGNIWAWTPQVQVERRVAISDSSKFAMQFGILAPLSGESPAAEYNWMPSAGERSRVPAYATRLAWQLGTGDRLATLGAGAYYSRQNWGFGRTVDAWAATADWDIPLGKWFTLSGEAYRGRAIGGLGAGASGSVLFRGVPLLSTSSVLALNSAGGWAQFKFKPMERIEFNAAFGEDYPFRQGLRPLLLSRSIEGSPASRNASGFLNVIYQPRSNLLFSIEYRRLWTSSFYDPKQTADHVSISSGIVF